MTTLNKTRNLTKFKKLAFKRKVRLYNSLVLIHKPLIWIYNTSVYLPRSIINIRKEKSIRRKLYILKSALKEK